MSNILKALIAKIIADGTADDDEAQELDTVIFANGSVDREEMDTLFEVNDKVTSTTAKFDALLCKAAVNHILSDGNFQEAESQYLIGKIKGDGITKTNESLLVTVLILNAMLKNITVPASFMQFAAEIGVIA